MINHEESDYKAGLKGVGAHGIELFIQIRRGVLINIISALFVFSYLHITGAQFSGLTTWLCTIIAISLLRYILMTKAIQSHTNASYARWHLSATVIMALTGIAWGLVYVIYYPQMTDFQRMFLALILTGGSTMAIVSLSRSAWCYFAFVIPTLFPVMILNTMSLNLDHLFFATAILIYIVFNFYLFFINRQSQEINYRLMHKQHELIRQLKIVNDHLSLTAITDGMTGLSNRGHFNKRLQADWMRAKRAGQPLALLIIDVDFFKQYNDAYGHIKGDECLMAIADVLKSIAVRETDLAARYGGDELAMILYDTNTEGAMTMARRIATGVKDLRIEHSESPYNRVTLSIGLASIVPLPENQEELILSQADKALYKAKDGGRNRIEAL